MNIGVIGLGLIGGSVAKSIKQTTPHTVLGYDIDENVVRMAKLIEAIDLPLDDVRIGACDMLILALYPRDIVKWVEDNAEKIAKGTVVMDCGGVKECVCEALFPLADKHGFTFVGAHPMAGIERSGFANAQGSLFRNASIVLTPPAGTDLELLHSLKKFWGTLGFTNFEITTPAEHDRRIAFTSQLAHVVSGAFIQSPTAVDQFGFSAGSYRDMTRVARLNERMWAELFIENRENLSAEIGTLIDNLKAYKQAIDDGDEQALTAILRRGRERKELSDRKEMRE